MTGSKGEQWGVRGQGSKGESRGARGNDGE